MTAKKKEEAPQSLWDKLSHIDVSDRIEEKNGMKYLSWAWAWGTLKENCPDATYENTCSLTGHLPPIAYHT